VNRASVLWKLAQLFCWILIIADTKLPPHFSPFLIIELFSVDSYRELDNTHTHTHTHTVSS